ncbi:hypothetical protein NKH77_50590 [Streptomyces sp. M19]
MNGLIGEHGPMFRVFTEDEVEVLRRWIARLPERASTESGDGDLSRTRRGAVGTFPANRAPDRTLDPSRAQPVPGRAPDPVPRPHPHPRPPPTRSTPRRRSATARSARRTGRC